MRPLPTTAPSQLSDAPAWGRVLRRVWHLSKTVCAFALFGAGGFCVSWLLCPLIWAVSCNKERATRRCQAAIGACFRFFLRVLSGLSLFRVNWDLAAPCTLPTPSVIVCNHPCLLDTVTMVARYRHVVCLVKVSWWRNPCFYGLARMAGYIPASDGTVASHQRMLELALNRINRGYSILGFPECRRTPLSGILPLRRGPFEIARRAHVPLQAVYLHCTPRTLAREQPLHRMPTELALYDALELKPCMVANHRLACKDAQQRIENLFRQYDRAARTA